MTEVTELADQLRSTAVYLLRRVRKHDAARERRVAEMANSSLEALDSQEQETIQAAAELLQRVVRQSD